MIDAGLSSQYVSALQMAAACGSEPFTIELAGADIGARGYIDLTMSACVPLAPRWSSRRHRPGLSSRPAIPQPISTSSRCLRRHLSLGGRSADQGQIDIGTPSDAFTQPDAKAYAVIAQFPNMPAVIDGSQMQDAIPTIAVLAAFNETPVRFVGIENLRVKECDRIRAVSTGLNAIRQGLAKERGRRPACLLRSVTCWPVSASKD